MSSPTGGGYQAGQFVMVKYGVMRADGRQSQQIAKLARPTPSGRGWFAWKWLANGRRWTKLVPIMHGEILRPAGPSDAARFPGMTYRAPLVLHRSGCSDPNCDAIGCRP